MVFWTLGVLFIAFQICFMVYFPDATLDINIHDTYLVIAYAHFFHVFGIWFILCGMGYWILQWCKVTMLKWLNWVHLIFSLLFILGMVIGSAEFSLGLDNYDLMMWLGTSWLFGLVFFILGQISYFLNILISTVRKVKSR